MSFLEKLQIKNIMWNNLVILCILSILILFLVGRGLAYQSEPEEVIEIEKLPFCGDEDHKTINRRLLYVSTLDGKLTALDLTNDGRVHWSVQTAPGPLLSSSIHRLELTNNGQLVRMIPSLSGSLYKFDGETIDPIPITVDNLLSSSFKFSEDLVISGGKETRSYGISLKTGQMLYECSLQGCLNMTDAILAENADAAQEHHDVLSDDVIIIRRKTQTVRAIEPRTGSERWNFSVGHHEAEILKSPECHDKTFSSADLALFDVDIKVVVPEGIICAVSKGDPSVILWKYQFDHPIVNVWQNDRHDNLKSIDLFQSTEWIWNGAREGVFENDRFVSPSIYLGMFQKQLYIQESEKLRQLVHEHANQFSHHLITNELHLPRIPWKPYPAGKTSLALIADDSYKVVDTVLSSDEENVETQIESTSVTALSVLYASEYVNGNGFYLFSKDDLNKTETALCDKRNSTTNSTKNASLIDIPDEGTPVEVMFVSLWFWWKEIVVISLTTALILNLLLAPKIHRKTEIVVEKYVEVPVPMAEEAFEDSERKSRKNSQRSFSESGDSGISKSNEFTSRFLTDFDLVQCLGKGGFGVVFEAKNKIDDVNYAIKRISLPNKKESRDRVMREVKTLANCEHHNIVRYFQAWVENPPPGWQECEDRKWLEAGSQSYSAIDIETPDGSVLPRFPLNQSTFASESASKYLHGKRKTWTKKLEDSGFPSKNHFNKWNGNYNDNDDDCSFIEFRNSDDESPNDEDATNNSSHCDSSTTGSCNRRGLENGMSNKSDSFEIEFKHSTHNEMSNNNNYAEPSHIISKDSSAVSGPRKRGHARPLSLDLSIKGSGIKLDPPKTSSKVYLYIQMQLCQKQSLRDWLQEHKACKRRPQVDKIFSQIVDAVEYVHQKGLIHRDLKPSNIFFSLDGQIKIGDFGLVTDMKDIPNIIMACGDKTGLPSCSRHTQQVGTYLYMSPEQLQGKSYNFKVDIFSIGLIFFELLVDFGTEMERTKTLKSLREGIFPSEFQKTFQKEYNLLKMMLSKNPNDRPDTSNIKESLNGMIVKTICNA